VYDAENKMIEAKDANGNTLGRYFYDGEGKRVKKVVPNSEETIFVYDAGGKLIAEFSNIVASQQEAKTSYLTNDHLGSPRITTDGNGKVISRRDFMPFGEEVTRANYSADNVRQKFTGYERDAETDLDFAQARMLNTSIGRFNTPDPYNVILEKERGEDEDEQTQILVGFISNPQRWNLYVYVVNNPLSFNDPDGQTPRTINVFLETHVLSKEQLKEWEDWAATAQKKDKNLKINIYKMSATTPGTVNAFLESLKAKDTATILWDIHTTKVETRRGS
jgi:RHS repeat-associated protein